MSGFGKEAVAPQTRVKSTWDTALIYLAVASRVLALIVLAVYLPVLMAAGLLVVMTSPGPAFIRKGYKRSRGVGSVVYLYEFRTECWQTWRETSVGKLLRTIDLHRVPRLANVLMGEVGVGERVEAIRP